MGPVLRLPPDRSWLIRLTPYAGMQFGGELEHMLTHDAEMMALVASDPRFGRILRPMFHMIGRPVPACVPTLPPRAPRVRTPRAATPKAPRPIQPVTGRALLKYLPWKKPRPWPPLPGARPGAAGEATEKAGLSRAVDWRVHIVATSHRYLRACA